MRRALVTALLFGPAALVACSLVRSLDGYSDDYGKDASDGPPSEGAPGEGAADACVNCDVEILVQKQSRPHGVAVTTKSFFWTTEGDNAVSKCAIAGCNGQIEVHGNQQTPTDIVADTDRLMWVNSTGPSLGFCAVDDCGNTLAYYPSGPDASPVAVAVGGGLGPYWTTTSGIIEACAGCSIAGAGPIAEGGLGLRGIAVASTRDGTMPFWARQDIDAIMRCQHRACVGTMALPDSGVADTGGGPQVFIDQQGPVDRVAVDPNNVYWSNDVAIKSCPITGCTGPPLLIANDQQAPRGLVVDDKYVYWTNGDNTVRACPTSGCTGQPMILADGQDDPQGIAVNATHVYWASRNGGWVARKPKPK
jgi:hypothetical protein